MLTAIFVLLMAGAESQQVPPIMYSTEFSERYSQVSAKPLQFAPDTPLEPKVVAASRRKYSRATLYRTDGAKIPYDKAEAHITIHSELGPTTCIQVRTFRMVGVTWLTERLLLIRRNIGRVAEIEEIYDIVEQKWLFQQTLFHRWP